MKKLLFNWFCIIITAGWIFPGDLSANSLFQGRRIHLTNEDNRIFTIGVTGTTAGYNYRALIENARQESISLGEFGYWESIDDPPSFLRNYDLQLVIKNNFKGKFKIEFEYDKRSQDILYRIKEGVIKVKLDNSEYYPTLIIDSIAAVIPRDDAVIQNGLKRFLFFDFNSFDAHLRKYYGSIQDLIKHPDYSSYFYYYESGDYNSYYFKTYQTVTKLNTDKMGLSQENGALQYYQNVLDNLKSRFGTDFADQAIIVSRFGKQYSKELKEYAQAIGISKNMVITFWSYDDL